MTTPFKMLRSLAGLSQREASDFLSVRLETIKAWETGRKSQAPASVLTELRDLIDLIDQGADNALDVILEKIERTAGSDKAIIELGYCVDDHEAQSLGLPCVGAHNALLARVIAGAPDNVTIELVPRGSTPGTAAAIDQHQ